MNVAKERKFTGCSLKKCRLRLAPTFFKRNPKEPSYLCIPKIMILDTGYKMTEYWMLVNASIQYF